MDHTLDGRVTIEEWMGFFHSQWETSNEKVLALIGSMEGHIANYEAEMIPPGRYRPCLPSEVSARA